MSICDNVKAAEEFLHALNKLIIDENSLLKQIFNMNKTALYWKRMSGRTFIYKEAISIPDFKTFKDRISVSLVVIVASHKLKPFVIWHSENSTAFRHVKKGTLPK